MLIDSGALFSFITKTKLNESRASRSHCYFYFIKNEKKNK